MKFSLGATVATPGALETFGPALIVELLRRHQNGDWGDLDAHDRRENERALKTGARLFSAYETPAGRCWLITEEADDSGARRSTCALRPRDY